jgi:hypothetical protein
MDTPRLGTYRGRDVFTLRCTAKLLRRLRVTADTPSGPPSTVLGDWYANLIFTRPQLVLAVSDRTLLPVLVPVRDSGRLVMRIREAVGHMLRAVGVPDEAITAEQNAMLDVVIGKTASRRVLGSMNDFIFMLDAYRGHGTLLEVALHLAETPCGPLKMNSPRIETLRVFDVRR